MLHIQEEACINSLMQTLAVDYETSLYESFYLGGELSLWNCFKSGRILVMCLDLGGNNSAVKFQSCCIFFFSRWKMIPFWTCERWFHFEDICLFSQLSGSHQDSFFLQIDWSWEEYPKEFLGRVLLYHPLPKTNSSHLNFSKRRGLSPQPFVREV